MLSIETILLKIRSKFISSKLKIGKKVRVSKDFELILKNGKLTIGDFFSTRKDVSLLVDDNGELIIGNNVFMNRNCSISTLKKIVIGNDCLFGENVKIYDHNHIYGKGKLTESGFSKEQVMIGNNVWICSNVVICAGVTIGNNCVIGANSTVYKDIPDNSVLLSNGNIKHN